MSCLEVWQLERSVNVIYQSRQSVDVLPLCETWHDAVLVSIRRLRAEGLSVVERARPWSLAVNHSSAAVVATAGVRWRPSTLA